MYIFAHVFAGALLGLILWHLVNDRRAILIGIAGSVLPDLVDKPLGFLFPAVLGSGRTVFHSLGIVLIVMVIVVFFLTGNRLLGAGMTGAILLHQIFDEMWMLPANWFYPLFGPFQGSMIPEYIGTYFWFEITNPSEWLFMTGSVMILIQSNITMTQISFPSLSRRTKAAFSTFVVMVFGTTGIYLVAAGLLSTAGTFITPLYNHLTTVVAGLLFLFGAVILWRQNTITGDESGN